MQHFTGERERIRCGVSGGIGNILCRYFLCFLCWAQFGGGLLVLTANAPPDCRFQLVHYYSFHSTLSLLVHKNRDGRRNSITRKYIALSLPLVIGVRLGFNQVLLFFLRKGAVF